MWRIKQIFDGEYGCEERSDGEKARCVVTLENERGERRELSVYDEPIVIRLNRRGRFYTKISYCIFIFINTFPTICNINANSGFKEKIFQNIHIQIPRSKHTFRTNIILVSTRLLIT